MGTTEWIEGKLAQRRIKARQRIAARELASRQRHRVWERDIARVALLGSILILGIVVIEIGRKATHLL
ncbi:hypothetical protein HL658_22085 [Azospirillum sp. RWY-5-1]|uniref:Uncharacterized protein n=1 Tax=Azospirillum oleiclasticum TaxID=2735135 RepID=A0ABX2TAH7_9PROT|nr:hypothetical protein [Azospirillum oleiclasticum]NYZ15238.1 hypothetical protein [Azospirillum oleiclasticum]NYZ21341.1 hypothetical protein [Azospirillum oleiclasticum]